MRIAKLKRVKISKNQINILTEILLRGTTALLFMICVGMFFLRIHAIINDQMPFETIRLAEDIAVYLCGGGGVLLCMTCDILYGD